MLVSNLTRLGSSSCVLSSSSHRQGDIGRSIVHKYDGSGRVGLLRESRVCLRSNRFGIFPFESSGSVVTSVSRIDAGYQKKYMTSYTMQGNKKYGKRIRRRKAMEFTQLMQEVQYSQNPGLHELWRLSQEDLFAMKRSFLKQDDRLDSELKEWMKEEGSRMDQQDMQSFQGQISKVNSRTFFNPELRSKQRRHIFNSYQDMHHEMTIQMINFDLDEDEETIRERKESSFRLNTLDEIFNYPDKPILLPDTIDYYPTTNTPEKLDDKIYREIELLTKRRQVEHAAITKKWKELWTPKTQSPKRKALDWKTIIMARYPRLRGLFEDDERPLRKLKQWQIGFNSGTKSRVLDAVKIPYILSKAAHWRTMQIWDPCGECEDKIGVELISDFTAPPMIAPSVWYYPGNLTAMLSKAGILDIYRSDPITRSMSFTTRSKLPKSFRKKLSTGRDVSAVQLGDDHLVFFIYQHFFLPGEPNPYGECFMVPKGELSKEETFVTQRDIDEYMKKKNKPPSIMSRILSYFKGDAQNTTDKTRSQAKQDDPDCPVSSGVLQQLPHVPLRYYKPFSIGKNLFVVGYDSHTEKTHKMLMLEWADESGNSDTLAATEVAATEVAASEATSTEESQPKLSSKPNTNSSGMSAQWKPVPIEIPLFFDDGAKLNDYPESLYIDGTVSICKSEDGKLTFIVAPEETGMSITMIDSETWDHHTMSTKIPPIWGASVYFDEPFNRLIVVGGFSAEHAEPIVRCFDLIGQKWTVEKSMGPLPLPAYAGIVQVGPGAFGIAGGYWHTQAFANYGLQPLGTTFVLHTTDHEKYLFDHFFAKYSHMYEKEEVERVWKEAYGDAEEAAETAAEEGEIEASEAAEAAATDASKPSPTNPAASAPSAVNAATANTSDTSPHVKWGVPEEHLDKFIILEEMGNAIKNGQDPSKIYPPLPFEPPTHIPASELKNHDEAEPVAPETENAQQKE